MVRSKALCVGWIACCLWAGPALAAEPELPQALSEAAELARRAAESVLRSLKPVLDAVPQYAAPEVMPNGDIVIRRKNPPQPAPAPRQPGAPSEQLQRT